MWTICGVLLLLCFYQYSLFVLVLESRYCIQIFLGGSSGRDVVFCDFSPQQFSSCYSKNAVCSADGLSWICILKTKNSRASDSSIAQAASRRSWNALSRERQRGLSKMCVLIVIVMMMLIITTGPAGCRPTDAPSRRAGCPAAAQQQ